jgi:hypothetical protein
MKAVRWLEVRIGDRIDHQFQITLARSGLWLQGRIAIRSERQHPLKTLFVQCCEGHLAGIVEEIEISFVCMTNSFPRLIVVEVFPLTLLALLADPTKRELGDSDGISESGSIAVKLLEPQGVIKVVLAV